MKGPGQGIYSLTADPSSGAMLDEAAADLAQIMRAHNIGIGFVIHNDRRYQVILQPPFRYERVDAKGERIPDE